MTAPVLKPCKAYIKPIRVNAYPKNAAPIWERCTAVLLNSDGWYLTVKHSIGQPNTALPFNTRKTYRLPLTNLGFKFCHSCSANRSSNALELDKIEVFADGEPVNFIKLHNNFDLALMKVNNPQISEKQMFPVLSSIVGLKLNQTVYSFGYTGNAIPTSTQKIESSKDLLLTGAEFTVCGFPYTYDQDKFIETLGRIPVGNSGGPLVDSNGLIHGICFASRQCNKKNLWAGYSIRVNEIVPWLKKHNIQYNVRPAPPTASQNLLLS